MQRFSGETKILDAVRRKIRLPAGSGVRLGIGDDCAIYRPRGSGEDLLFTTDLLVEDVHFRRTTHRPEEVGWKALARGLSDIAAMGGTPRFCLLSLAVARWAKEGWVDAFYRGLLQLADREGAPLIGGDLARAEKVTADIVVCGSAPRDKALRRDGARPGDEIYVSGLLGGSALGLETRRGAAWKRHVRPEPRLAMGKFVRERLHATSAMDLSDGLSMDLWRLCRASGASAVIEKPPRFPRASLEQALHGGEDYELLFTVRPRTQVPGEFGGVPLTRIGAVRRGRPGHILCGGNSLEPLGYDHFR